LKTPLPDPVPAHRRLELKSGKQLPTRLPRRKPTKLPGSLQAGFRSMNPFPKHLVRLLHRVPGKESRSINQEGTPVLNIFFISNYLVNREPLCRVPEDINPAPSTKSVPVGSESPKADKPPSPQADTTTPEPLKPPSATGAQSPIGADGTLTSPIHMASGQDAANNSPKPESTEWPEMPPPSPRSYGLEAPCG
jgi:hypothetical protein